MIKLVQFFTYVLFFITFSSSAHSLDYRIVDGAFFTSQGEIPADCFGQLITEFNGDNTVQSIFLTRASLRGCIDANISYPGGIEKSIRYQVKEQVAEHEYALNVCAPSGGSLVNCDRILVRFVQKEYKIKNSVKHVLVLEKTGEW